MGKYYWLKLKNDFFTQPKIKKLRKIAGGDTYTIIYLKMQLLSLKNDGKIFFDGIEESFEEEMALTIDEDVDNVSVTIQYLLRQGLMERVETDEYLMTETTTLIGSESESAERVRKCREKKKKALQCNDGVTLCNTEIEKEKDTELKKDIEIEAEKNSGSDEPTPTPKKKKEPKHKYGEYEHVLLTNEERNRLFEEKGEVETLEAIKYLDEYIEMYGKKYKNHNLVLRKWVFDAVQEKKEKKPKQQGQAYGMNPIDWDSI